MTHKILVADDEQNIVMLLEIMLKDLDAEVFTAENGEIAIEKAKDIQPDLIISDVVMPKKNGFEVCRAVRAEKSLEHTPIILLSALGDEYNKLTGFEEGADDYVIKPFNVEDLKVRAKALIIRHQSRKESVNNPTPVIDAPVETSAPDGQLKTSLAPLDQKLFGGLPKGSNILLHGLLGVGKSSFSRQFLCHGLENDEKCLFVAVDDDPKKIRSSLNTILSEPVKANEDINNLRIVDAYSWSSMNPVENEKFAISGTLELTQLSGIISDASFELGHTPQVKCGGRRVIDSITSLLINFDLSSVQQFLNQIARTSMAFGGVTTLFIIEDGTIDEKIMNNVKYIMDGVIEFSEFDNKRWCRVQSMKWAKFNPEWVEYPVHSKNTITY